LESAPRPLGDPAHLFGAAGVGVDEHVEQADALDVGAVVVGVNLALDVAGDRLAIVDAFGRSVARLVLGVVAFGRLGGGRVHELVAALHPAVAADDPVVDGEANLVLIMVLPPEVVEHLFDDDGLRGLFGLARVDDEARVVDGDSRCDDILGGEHQVDDEPVVGVVAFVLAAAVEVDHPPPLVVEVVRVAPPFRAGDLVAVEGELLGDLHVTSRSWRRCRRRHQARGRPICPLGAR
jgi:hypothetical protein